MAREAKKGEVFINSLIMKGGVHLDIEMSDYLSASSMSSHAWMKDSVEFELLWCISQIPE